MSTEEELVYNDAIRQIQRSLHRRLKALEESLGEVEEEEHAGIKIRMDELKRVLQMLDSLHR